MKDDKWNSTNGGDELIHYEEEILLVPLNTREEEKGGGGSITTGQIQVVVPDIKVKPSSEDNNLMMKPVFHLSLKKGTLEMENTKHVVGGSTIQTDHVGSKLEHVVQVVGSSLAPTPKKKNGSCGSNDETPTTEDDEEEEELDGDEGEELLNEEEEVGIDDGAKGLLFPQTSLPVHHDEERISYDSKVRRYYFNLLIIFLLAVGLLIPIRGFKDMLVEVNRC